MPYVLLTQRVKNYAKWRRSFEENAEKREEAGSTGGHIFRDTEDRELITLFLSWQDLDRAREYLSSDEVAEEREAGGVTGEPDVQFLEEMGRPQQ